MAFSITPISQVRVIGPLIAATIPAAGGDAGGATGGLSEPGFAEVVFASSAADDKLHQVYVDGRLAGCTDRPEARSLRVPIVGDGAALVAVVAVDQADRLTDYGADIIALGGLAASRLRIVWYGGNYLGDGLTHFDLYLRPSGTPATGDERPVNDEPIPPTIDGRNYGGFGRGGFGRGGFGRSAMQFSFITPRLAPGDYLIEVAAVDESATRTVAQLQAAISGYARPPRNVRIDNYDPATRTVRLAWLESPDL